MIYLDHLIDATRGVLAYPGRQTHFEAFNHDTRQLIPGEMFVAVRGEHGDGHDFALDAIRRGAAGLLVEAYYMRRAGVELQQELERSGAALVVVEDTRLALQHYAHAILRRWRPVVIAVTGSTGKTSTKEALAAVLGSSYATFKSWQNYNDLLGLPLSLGRLEERHEYAVLEMACDHPGEIGQLCAIAHPALGVLTNISPNQLQYFGSMKNLAAELFSLLTWLPVAGAGFVGDLHGYTLPAEIKAPIQIFEQEQARNVQVFWEGLRFQIVEENQEIELAAPLLGRHHVSTLLAAYRVGRYCGVSIEEIRHALERIEPLRGRLRALPGREATTLLDDTHNACPASMVAGLATLRDLPAGLRIAVLGDMFRLGEFEAEGHRQIGEVVASCVDYLVTRGERAAQIAEAARQAGLAPECTIATATHEDATQVVQRLLSRVALPENGEDVHPATARCNILIKGSEETRMERVTEMLIAHPELAPEELVRQTPGWKQIVLMRPERPTWLEIDLSAIANNIRRIKALVGPTVRVLVALKADGYGHGALKIARTALHNGASMLGVATVSEAIPLREAGITAPILVFGYVPLWQMREAVRLDLTITVYSLDSAQALARAAEALGKTVRVHVKVDSGMGRLGVRSEQIDEILSLLHAIRLLSGLELEGIFTHFARADTIDLSHAYLQLSRFRRVLHVIEAEGLRPPLVHAANSAATLNLPEARFDMVRPGISLYGLDPSPEVRLPEGFRPALSFKTQVAQVKLIPAGECISYGCTYITERPTEIAVLPVGYADGFRRAPVNWGSVLIHGQEAPLLGRVCMDQCMVDVSHIADVRVGDEVVLIGRQGEATLS
ncbi:MAG TPA: alanine racemase, partial [Ktedonobacteraceae bacterium]|nr:alanine racemase [Ktedonobacteraceae bacterium]